MYKTYVMTFKDAPLERLENAKKLAKKMKGEVFIGGTDTFKNFFNLMHLRTMVTSPKKERHNKNKNQTTKVCDL